MKMNTSVGPGGTHLHVLKERMEVICTLLVTTFNTSMQDCHVFDAWKDIHVAALFIKSSILDS